MFSLILSGWLCLAPIFAQDPVEEGEFRPIIFLHGMLASGDTYSQQAVNFLQEGWQKDQIVLFDWNTLGESAVVDRLRDTIAKYSAQSFDNKVHLVGHSAGTNVCYRYLSDSARALAVHTYAHLAGSPRKTAAGTEAGVRMLNIYSENDPIVPGDSISGAKNVRFKHQDHYQVATSEETFYELFTFFQGESPGRLDKNKRGIIEQGGKAVRLGSNEPMAGSEIVIYALDSNTAHRQTDTVLYRGEVSTSGHWGPVSLAAGRTYEYVLRPATGPAIHYFRTADSLDQPFVYLRAFPRPESPAGRLLSALPAPDSVGILAIFSSRQAVVAGRDRLEIDGRPLSTTEWAPPEKSHIAWFLYDANGNEKSDDIAIPQFAWAPFLQGIDSFFNKIEPATHTVRLNDQTLTFSTQPFREAGVIVLML